MIVLCICRQPTSFDLLCYESEDKCRPGARVYGDCDHFMREIMRCLLSDEDLECWEDSLEGKQAEYSRQREQPPQLQDWAVTREESFFSSQESVVQFRTTKGAWVFLQTQSAWNLFIVIQSSAKVIPLHPHSPNKEISNPSMGFLNFKLKCFQTMKLLQIQCVCFGCSILIALFYAEAFQPSSLKHCIFQICSVCNTWEQ